QAVIANHGITQHQYRVVPEHDSIISRWSIRQGKNRLIDAQPASSAPSRSHEHQHYDDAPHGAISTTIFPSCSARSNRSSAARASVKGDTRSTTGRRAPALRSRTIPLYSARLPMVEPMMFHWYQKSRRRSSPTFGPVVAPQVTSRPARRSDRNDSSHVASPTFSITTSAPRLSVSVRTS